VEAIPIKGAGIRQPQDRNPQIWKTMIVARQPGAQSKSSWARSARIICTCQKYPGKSRSNSEARTATLIFIYLAQIIRGLDVERDDTAAKVLNTHSLNQ
jgi:hypothetical protein